MDIGWHTIKDIEWHSIQDIDWHKMAEIRQPITYPGVPPINAPANFPNVAPAKVFLEPLVVSLGKLAGAFIGGTPGYVIGEAAGGIAGSSADKYAGKVMKGLLDGKITAAEYATKFNGTKYANILKDAASRGNKSLAATHFLLSQKDSEYRKMTQGDDEE